MSSAPSVRPGASGEALEVFSQQLMRLDWHGRNRLLLTLTRGELVKLGQHNGMVCDNRWTWLDLHDTLQTVLTGRARQGVQLDMFEQAAAEKPLFDDE